MMITYQKNDTPVHRLNPVAKLSLLLIYCVALFIADSLLQMGMLFSLLLVSFAAGKVSISHIGGRRFFVMFAATLLLINVLFTRSGEEIFGFWIIRITLDGIMIGIMKASLFVGIVLSSMLFVATTDSNMLTQGLMQAGVPYRYGYMLVTSMRLAPVFEMESSTVRNAQVARGLQLDAGGLSKMVKLAKYTFVPLIMSALSKVDSLTVSMEGRAFGMHSKRTFIRNGSFGKEDIAILAAALGAIVAILAFAG